MKRLVFLLVSSILLIGIFVLCIITNPGKGYWSQVDGKWYYINEKDNSKETGWINDSGNWYYLNADGVMQTGWLYDENNWYYLYSNGQMASNTYIDGYYLSATGAWTENIQNANYSSGKEVLYYKKVPVRVISITRGNWYSAEITVKSDEYNLEKTFFQDRSMPYSNEVWCGQIVEGSTIYAELLSWKSGDTVTRRDLNMLEK